MFPVRSAVSEADVPASPTASDAPAAVPQANIFSSLKQAFKQDFDHEVVRGHFDVGAGSGARRYYCLADPKTGRKEPNGVPGKPVPRPDGMTGIKATAVSTYGCDSAEQQGILVTTGYVLSGALSGVNTPAPRPADAAAAPGAARSAEASPGRVDVAGVKLGMSPDEVRAVLRSKQLLDYYESTDSLVHSGSGGDGVRSPPGAHFVNFIAAWTAPGSSGGSGQAVEDAESFEVMFTPVPGRERAMAIIHSSAYSLPNAIRESDLKRALVTKYGGFAAAGDLPASPTWRIQSGGGTQVGDSCERRGVVGGLEGSSPAIADRKNLALKTTLEEFRFQIERCGVAIVTEDHAAGGDAPHGERSIVRFTVTAYSPSIGFEGAAAAAQLIGAGANAGTRADLPRKGQPAPAL